MMEYTANYKSIAKWKVYDSVDQIAVDFYRLLVERIERSKVMGKRFSIALSGGNTPLKIYNYLATPLMNSPLLENLLIFWGDERCVPPDDPESNFGNAWKNFLEKIHIPIENIFRIKGENEPYAEAKRYAHDLMVLPSSNGFPVLDLLLLGVGDDGHTASIFPGDLQLLNIKEWVSTAVHPITHQNRLTLSGNVLNNAHEVIFIATGRDKVKIIHDIFKDREAAKNYPANHIRPRSGNLLWFMDSLAAEGLE